MYIKLGDIEYVIIVHYLLTNYGVNSGIKSILWPMVRNINVHIELGENVD